MPGYSAVQGRIKLLAQRHPFALKPNHAPPDADALYSVYIAELGRGDKIIKVGHARHSKARVKEFNKYRLAREPQWRLEYNLPIGSVQEAIEV